MPNFVVNDVAPRVQYVANGATTVFTFPFAVIDAADLKVWFGDGDTASAHTVTGLRQTAGGEVQFAVPPPDGTRVTILRDMPVRRLTDFQDAGEFRASAINEELDRLAMMVQQVELKLDRAAALEPTTTPASLTLPAPASDGFIRWNSAATALIADGTVPAAVTTSATNAASAAASASAASASQTAAASSAANAATSASSAATSATNSAASAGAAATSATAASASATTAAAHAATASAGSQFVAAAGTADAMTAAPGTAWTSYVNGAELRLRAVGTNTITTPTLNVSSLGAKTLVKQGGAALAAGDYVTNQELTVRYNSTSDKLEILNPKASAYSIAGQTEHTSGAAVTDFLGANVGSAERRLSILNAAKSFGKILQIVTSEKSAQASYSSTSEGDISGMNISITPKSSTSTILLFAFLDGNTGYDGGGSPELSRWTRVKWTLNDNSACDYYGLPRLNWAMKVTAGGGGAGGGHTVVAEDAPGSTSAQTYKLRAWLNDVSGPTSLYINMNAGGADGRSLLMAIEVASKS
jgi:hypothetical protein